MIANMDCAGHNPDFYNITFTFPFKTKDEYHAWVADWKTRLRTAESAQKAAKAEWRKRRAGTMRVNKQRVNNPHWEPGWSTKPFDIARRQDDITRLLVERHAARREAARQYAELLKAPVAA